MAVAVGKKRTDRMRRRTIRRASEETPTDRREEPGDESCGSRIEMFGGEPMGRTSPSSFSASLEKL